MARKTDKNVKLLEQFAAARGIGLRAAQKNRKNNSAAWLEFTRENNITPYMHEHGISVETEYSPSDGEKRARIVFENCWKRLTQAEESLDKALADRCASRKTIMDHQTIVGTAMKHKEAAQMELERIAQDKGRLIPRRAIEELKKQMGPLFDVLQNLPDEIASQVPEICAAEAERTGRRIIMERINPLIAQLEKAFKAQL